MKIRTKKCSVEISFYFIAVAALMMIVFPQSKGLFCFVFCIMHEAGHLAAMLLFGKRPVKICFGYFGMKIVTGGRMVSTFGEIMIALAGPLVNIILFAFFICMKANEAAYLNIGLAVFNLMPVAMLDGGRIIMAVAKPTFPIKKIGLTVSIIILVLGICVAVYAKNNFTLLFVGIYLVTGNFA